MIVFLAHVIMIELEKVSFRFKSNIDYEKIIRKTASR